MGYQVLWSVSGADPVGGQTNSGQSFSIVTPDSSVAVTVSVSIFFDDGTIISDSLSFHSLDLAEAIWRDFLCKISHERLEPIPWWEWDPEKVQQVAEDYSQEQFKVIAERVELIGETLRQLGELGIQPGR
jgi:hypothetical protein